MTRSILFAKFKDGSIGQSIEAKATTSYVTMNRILTMNKDVVGFFERYIPETHGIAAWFYNYPCKPVTDPSFDYVSDIKYRTLDEEEVPEIIRMQLLLGA